MPQTDDDVLKKDSLPLEGTPSPAPVTPSPEPPENGDMDEEDAEEGASASQPENAQEPKQRNLDAEAGKVSALQKRLNELEKQNAELSGAVDEVRTYYQNDPEGYEGFRKYIKKSRNIDLGDYETLYGQKKQTEQPQQAVPKTLEELRLIARQEFRAEMEAEAGVKEFVSAFPDLDPAKMSYEQKEAVKPTMVKVEQMAGFLKSQDPSLTMGQAYVTAYRALNPDAAIADARAQGEVAGRLKEIGSGVSATVGASAAQAPVPQDDVSFLPPSHATRYKEYVAEGKKDLADLLVKAYRERKGI